MWLIRTIPSLWYRYNADRQVIQCVSHASSYLIKVLKKSTKVAFEIAENAPPYCGVRGAGDVTLTRDGAEEVLSSLLQRYLDGISAILCRCFPLLTLLHPPGHILLGPFQCLL